MTHLPFIVGSYAIFLAAAGFASGQAALRLRTATHRLHAVDPRAASRRPAAASRQ